MIDLIGDIHGHADKLEELLLKLGYVKSNGIYSHPDRKVLFVGDYIDRGPKIRETLHIVRSMVESDNAVALMGNHEYNALCFHFVETEGGHLRKHLIKNIVQHYRTLEQFKNRQSEYEEYLEWFKTLPLYYETDTFKAGDGTPNDLGTRTFTITAANGDVIHGTINFIQWTSETTFEEVVVFDGGTGRFENATGEFNESVVVVWDTEVSGTFTAIGEGTLTY